MKLRNIIKIALCFLGLVIFVQSSMAAVDKEDDFVKFSNEKVNEALKRASSEGKLVFIDFYASWCAPCKWMDKTTFRDNKIINALEKSFIPIKVDIDDAQGFEMKNKYEINYLPTILILNSKGQLVERVEETLTATKLYDLLSMHDNHANKIKIQHDFNVSPKNLNGDEKSEPDPWKISKEDYYRYVEMEEKRNYRVQVGVYSDYESARNRVNEMREIFYEPVLVVNSMKEGQVLFKVMLGQFDSMDEAASFTKILQNDFNISGIVH